MSSSIWETMSCLSSEGGNLHDRGPRCIDSASCSCERLVEACGIGPFEPIECEEHTFECDGCNLRQFGRFDWRRKGEPGAWPQDGAK